jgi:hypothetical protein
LVKEVTKGIYPANFEVDWAKDIVEGDLWKRVSEEEELELQPFDTFGVATEKMPAERDFELHLKYETLYVCILCSRLCTLEEFKKVDRSLRTMIEAEAEGTKVDALLKKRFSLKFPVRWSLKRWSPPTGL